MHDYINDPSIDIYGLHLFRLVAEIGSFTRAGRRAGLTQSAITRQIQNVEARLGVVLLERTTRQVRPTPAGRFLLEQSTRILGDVAHSVQRLREEFADAPKLVRVGVSRSIGLAYLPGFFTRFQRRFPQVVVQVTHGTSAEVLAALEARELDVAVIERRYVGGSCPNIACLPSKNFIHSAKVASYFRRSKKFGIIKDHWKIDMAGVRAHKRKMRTRTLSEEWRFMKALIAAESDHLLGFAAIGAEMGELLPVVQIVMSTGLPYTVLRDMIVTHPTMSEGLVLLFSSVPARLTTQPRETKTSWKD